MDATAGAAAPENEIRPGSLLLAALRGNSLFSAVSGAALIVFGGPLAAWTAIAGALWLRMVGLSLMGFAVTMWLTSRQAAVPRRDVVVPIVLDVVWVAGSIILLVLVGESFASPGRVLVDAIAAVVAVFAFVQAIGLRRST